MIDGSEKRNRPLALNFRTRMFVKSTIRQTLAYSSPETTKNR